MCGLLYYMFMIGNGPEESWKDFWEWDPKKTQSLTTGKFTKNKKIVCFFSTQIFLWGKKKVVFFSATEFCCFEPDLTWREVAQKNLSTIQSLSSARVPF